MASRHRRPATPRRKLDKVPERWERVHKQGLKRLVHTEAVSTVKMRTEVRRVHSQLVSMLDGTKAEGLRALKQAREHMARTVAEQINKTRVRARDAALDQTQAELRQLTRDVRAAGKRVPDLAHKLGSAGETKASATAADLANADAIGNAFASRWAQSVLHHIVNASDEDETDVAWNARMVAAQMDHQIKRIAATETSKAYNDEHDSAINDALGDVTGDDEDDTGLAVESTEEADVWDGRGVFKMWNAYLDRATCVECRSHDGEIVAPSEPFSNRDVPGHMHPNCRCEQTLVYL